jgi:hypothetical protein
MGNILGSALGIAGAEFIWLLQRSTSSGSSRRGRQPEWKDPLLVSAGNDTPGKSQ